MTGFQLSIDWNFAALLEQLPDLLRKIANDDYNFRIDFYEQGSEFYLQFVSAGSEAVDVTYNSYSGTVTCSTTATKSERSSMFKKIDRLGNWRSARFRRIFRVRQSDSTAEILDVYSPLLQSAQ